MFMTSVGVPSVIYETVKNLRQVSLPLTLSQKHLA